MEHFVTLFDSLYLPQGLALHRSMQRHVPDYTLWILCMDDEVHGVLNMLKLPSVRLLRLSKLETKELKQVKPTRTKGEYCWTTTPFSPRFVFEADASVGRVTYIDADIWFRKNPAPIFREFEASGKHVLITDHAYAPDYDDSLTSGQYCVQFMTFVRAGGETVRAWWEARCLEWCFARVEDGKFGDQKYLDDWPERFAAQVHVLQNKELLLAPWNATRFPHGAAVCWHFHGLRILAKPNTALGIDCGSYPLPTTTLRNVYANYLDDLRSAVAQMREINVPVLNQGNRTLSSVLRAYLRRGWQALRKAQVHCYMRL
jgi:hypothetical protein